MKKTLLFIMICMVYTNLIAQNVTIPDANFKNYLVTNPNINTNGDTEISVAEAQSYTGNLLINGLSISDLTGIEAFVNINRLDCYNNNLTSLDVSNNLALTRLHCGGNQITSLDISTNTLITDIQCHNNQLNELNIANGNNSNINWMKAYGNNLSCIQVDTGYSPPLDVGVYSQGWTKGNSTFYSEDCAAFNQIVNIPDANFKNYLVTNSNINTNGDTEISVGEAQVIGSLLINGLSISDLTGIEAFVNITRLDCYNNNLTSLDVSNNLALTRLHCGSNQITSLDISANTLITDIQCHNNQLNELNIANGNNNNINWMKAYGNNLSCIQVDPGYTSMPNSDPYLVGWTRDAQASYSVNCNPTIYYVNVNATGTNNGTSWVNAYVNINDALTNTLEGDVIWIAKGMYTLADRNTPIAINTKDVDIIGGFSGTETTLADRDLTAIHTTNATIFTGDINNDDIDGNFTSNKTDNAERLFEVKAHDVTFDGIIFENIYDISQSGGVHENGVIFIPNGLSIINLKIKNSVIRNNYSNGYLLKMRELNGGLYIENTKFTNNTSVNLGLVYLQSDSVNGYVFTRWANVLVADNNTHVSPLKVNRVDWSNGSTLNVVLNNTTFVNNDNKETHGNVISASGNGSLNLTINNSIFWKNTQNGLAATRDVSGTQTFYGVTIKNTIAIATSQSDIGNYGTFNVTNITALNPATDNLNLTADYKPTATSNHILDQGDNTLYDIANFGNYDLAGNNRIVNATIDLGAFEYDANINNNITTWTGATDFNWNTASNWTNGVPTNTKSAIIPNVTTAPQLNAGGLFNVNDLEIQVGASLTIAKENGLIIEGVLKQNGSITIESDATTTGSLIFKGTKDATSSGVSTYKRYVSTNWHLLSNPFTEVQLISDIKQNVATNGSKYAIATYNNALSTSRYVYYNTSNINNGDKFVSGKGYSIKRNGAGEINLLGQIHGTSVSTNITDGSATGNKWNLVGNPFTASIAANANASSTNNFLTVNASQLEPTKVAIYKWNATTSSYDIINQATTGAAYIAPSEGFFVEAKNGGGNLQFTREMQEYVSGNVFARFQDETPSIKITAKNNKNTKTTDVKYFSNATKGLDIGYDAGVFSAQNNNNFSVYTQLVKSNIKEKFALQTLPLANYENTIIPLGINVNNTSNIEISAKVNNLPTNIKVYLEDKKENSFTNLSKQTYKVTLQENESGVGRFYIHTTVKNKEDLQVINQQNVNAFMVNNVLNITTSKLDENYTVTLFDLLGKQVLTKSFLSKGTNTVVLPKVSSGVYIVTIKTKEKQVFTKKVIVE